MGLEFGWKPQESRESIWIEDTSLVGVTDAARSAWFEDGDASHLRPFDKEGKAQIIVFRTLNSEEAEAANAFFRMGLSDQEAGARAAIVAFRLGVSFPGLDRWMTPDGNFHSVVVKDKGFRMLDEPFVRSLAVKYPFMTVFYGVKILKSTSLSDSEKKASSPPSTQTPSSEAASSTPVTTAPPPSEPGA